MKSLSTEGVVNVADRLRICADIEEARAKGNKVEVKRIDFPSDKWRPAAAPVSWPCSLDYRVKREPRIIYAAYNKTGALSYASTKPPLRGSPAVSDECAIAKFIEVVEE